MSERLTVHYNNEPIYDIFIDNSFEHLGEEVSKLSCENKRLCIVTESTVGPIYSENIKTILEKNSKEVFVFCFEAGEASKNLNVVKDLYEFLIINHFDRNDMLVALGGGVVGDLTGFAAATYLRGIQFIQIPTSLLSQVDSSVGGKTGVDFDSYKNMVGAFHQPKLVYSNISTLKTLTNKQFISGFGEVIKSALIKDKDFYGWLKEHSKEALELDDEALIHILVNSCNIKRIVVENDFKEKGERAHLNFGHTLGHAIEKLMNFSLLHGECVSLGTVCSSYISMKKGYITKSEYEDIISTLKAYKLPIYEDTLDVEEVVNATKLDKKMKAGSINFVVLSSIGCAAIDKDVDDDLMKASLLELK